MVAVGACLQKQLLQGADHLSPAPALLPDTLELISLAPQLLLAALLLAQAGLQPRFELHHTGTQAVLAVQQVLNDKLCQAQHLEQHWVHRLPTVVAHLSVQVTEGDTSNVLLQSGHVQLPGHAVHVHSADAPPVYALTARLELEGGECVDSGQRATKALNSGCWVLHGQKRLWADHGGRGPPRPLAKELKQDLENGRDPVR